MKKVLLWGLGALAVLATVGGLGLYFFIQSKSPAKEERISHGNEQLIANIDEQLKGVDLNSVRSKSHLIEQKSVQEIQEALDSQALSREELVAYYLLNIKEKDQNPEGNNAISEVNPSAIEEARKQDKEPTQGLLSGIPVLVKENINTNNMPTSAGSYALKDFVPSTNAPVVETLLNNGAIILGKTNLSEMSHWMSAKNPSGYSSKKGQTTNPFKPLEISPLGSSSGSAVAMATDLATVTLGTETVGSIVAPASVNSVVGYKPTRAYISGEGVIPITYSLDTVGPITKTVADAVTTYNASTDKSLAVTFDKNALVGKKVGLLKTDEAFDKQLQETLTELGATVEVIEVDTSAVDLPFVLVNDFEKDLNHYFSTYNAPIKSLKDLVAFNKEDAEVRMRYGQSHLEESLNPKRDDEKVKQIIKSAQDILAKTMDEHGFDVLVAKDNSGATLAAGAGGPEVSVPFGLLGETPVGATFFGKLDDDANVLALAYSFEQSTQLRQIP